MTTSDPNPPIAEATLDPLALANFARPPEVLAANMDDRWRLVPDELQPAGVALTIAGGQVAFDFTQAIDQPTSLRMTTGHATLDAQPPASGPYRLADSAMQWNTVQLPDVFGVAPAEARLQLRGDDGTLTDHTIDVVVTDAGVTISHTDTGVTTVDYASAPTAGTRAAPPEQFQWLRIESDAAGTVFSVYASLDGFVWALLFRRAMSLDMQAAFAATTITFSMTASGTTGSGRWTVGSINVQPAALQFAGLYLQSEDQAGFSYNRGVWSQFGPPLDGFRDDQTFDAVTGEWYDAVGNVHYQWVSAIAFAPDDPNTVYAIAANRVFLFISHDGGFHWTSRRMSFTDGTQGSPARPDRTRFDMFDLACPTRGELHVLAYSSLPGDNPGVYHTTDEGATWTRIATLTESGGQVFTSGGMRQSSSKVWWAQQTAEVDANTDVETATTAPRSRVLWSGALPWFVNIDDKPAAAPYLQIPPLDPVEWTDELGSTRNATVTVVTLASAGAWNPNVQVGVIWEDGIQTVWQNNPVDGIYAPIGTATPVHVQLMWQPASVSDSDWALYWSLTDDMAQRNRESRDARNDETGALLPPPPLPDLGNGPGQSGTLHRLAGNRLDKPEPVNSRAGIRFPRVQPPQADPNPLDCMGSVSPHRPENCAAIRQFWFAGPGSGGAKLHVLIYDDVTITSETTAEYHTERKAAYAMSGVLNAVVLDVEPADVANATWFGGEGMVYATGMTDPAVGSSHWDIVDGEDGYFVEDTATIGPPSAVKPVTYLRYEHPTWIWEDVPNYVTETPPLAVDTQPYPSGGGGAVWTQGLRLATFVTYGSSSPSLPDGWTLLDDSQATSSSYSGVLGGRGPSSTAPAYGQWAYIETGAWVTIIREYQVWDVTYDLLPMSICTAVQPIDWTTPAEPIEVTLPVHTDSYWLLTCAAGVYAVQTSSSSPDTTVTVTNRRFDILRANFDGSALETVGTIAFGVKPSDPAGTFYPQRMQVRPLNDDVCLISTWLGNGVWRVQSGHGATPIWTSTLRAQPWDAIALDENTFIAVANAIPDDVVVRRTLRPHLEARP